MKASYLFCGDRKRGYTTTECNMMTRALEYVPGIMHELREKIKPYKKMLESKGKSLSERFFNKM